MCTKMGEGWFGSIQLIDNFVSVHTLRWGKFGVDSYPKGSWSQRDFEAFGHKEIALDKTFTVAPLFARGIEQSPHKCGQEANYVPKNRFKLWYVHT